MIIFNRDNVIPNNSVIPPILDFLIHGGNFFINFFEHTLMIGKNDNDLSLSWIFFICFSFSFCGFYKIIYLSFNYSVYPLVEFIDLKGLVFLGITASILLIIGEYLYLKSLNIRNKNIFVVKEKQ